MAGWVAGLITVPRKGPRNACNALLCTSTTRTVPGVARSLDVPATSIHIQLTNSPIAHTKHPSHIQTTRYVKIGSVASSRHRGTVRWGLSLLALL